MQLIDKICDFVKHTTFNDLPADVVEFTKHLTLKTMAGMISGSRTESGYKMTNFIKNIDTSSEASVIGGGFKSSIEYAILANGHYAHAAELEDDQFPSATSDITVTPVILPVAECFNLSGNKIIEATALALEMMNRIGYFSLTPKGITDLPFYGVIGAAIATAKALDFDVEKIRNSIGIAIARASGYLVNFGTDAHYLESSMACRDGYLSAIFAKNGMTGLANNSDISDWLKAIHSNNKLPVSEVDRELGCKWFIKNIWIKKYPCCFLTHRQIDMLLDIKREYNITQDDVKYIELDVGPVDGTCDRPNPINIEDSRFSFQHILSGVLIEKEVDHKIFTIKKILDPLYRVTRQKIKVNIHDNWPPEFNSGIARITTALKDGKEITKSSEQALGGPLRPLTQEQFIKLYEKYTKDIINTDIINESCNLLLDLENKSAKDVATLMKMVTFI
jgi:2-methylcitrate dehydratase PrpD